MPTADSGRRAPDKSLGNARPVHGWGLELLAAEMLESPGLVSQRQVQVQVRDPGDSAGMCCKIGLAPCKELPKEGYPRHVPRPENLMLIMSGTQRSHLLQVKRLLLVWNNIRQSCAESAMRCRANSCHFWTCSQASGQQHHAKLHKPT